MYLHSTARIRTLLSLGAARRSAALRAFYAAVATFKIARCTTREAQIYFLLPR